MTYFVVMDGGVAFLANAAKRGLSIAAFALLAGCSISIPLGPFVDAEATGSIRSAASPLSAELDGEDWRIAEPILAQALLSGEPEAPARWSNPETGRSGAFQPVASPFARDGKPCRAFIARITIAGVSKMLQAIGCPGDAGDVVIDRVAPWKGI